MYLPQEDFHSSDFRVIVTKRYRVSKFNPIRMTVNL